MFYIRYGNFEVGFHIVPGCVVGVASSQPGMFHIYLTVLGVRITWGDAVES